MLADVVASLVSAEAAERDYGVRVVDGAVDEAATATLRGASRPEPSWWGRGAARERWDAVFPRELLDVLDTHLRTLPPLDRAPRRRALLHEVLATLPDAFPRTDTNPALLAEARTLAARLVTTL